MSENESVSSCAVCGVIDAECDRLWAAGSPMGCCSACVASGGCTHAARPSQVEAQPTLPHGTHPTEEQWQVAGALDDLVMNKGVMLDDDRLDWLVDWVERVVADRLAAHRQEWASYIENWDASVGPEPPTVGAIIAALRLAEPPFGVAREATA